MIISEFRTGAAFLGCGIALVLSACAEQQATQQAAQTATQAQSLDSQSVAQNAEEKIPMQRVIINLVQGDMPVADQVEALAKKYPQAKTLRVMPSFRQVVMEMSLEDMKTLQREPEVNTLSIDGTNRTHN